MMWQTLYLCGSKGVDERCETLYLFGREGVDDGINTIPVRK